MLSPSELRALKAAEDAKTVAPGQPFSGPEEQKTDSWVNAMGVVSTLADKYDLPELKEVVMPDAIVPRRDEIPPMDPWRALNHALEAETTENFASAFPEPGSCAHLHQESHTGDLGHHCIHLDGDYVCSCCDDFAFCECDPEAIIANNEFVAAVGSMKAAETFANDPGAPAATTWGNPEKLGTWGPPQMPARWQNAVEMQRETEKREIAEARLQQEADAYGKAMEERKKAAEEEHHYLYGP